MRRKLVYSFFTLLAGIILYLFSFYNYLLFHITVEFFTMLIGFLIFSISSISRKYNSSFLITLGPGIFVVSLLTFIHALTYKGMNIIQGFNSNLPTQLWIILNYMLAASILFAIWNEKRKVNYYLLTGIYFLIGSAAATLSFLRLFPASFIEGTGLTSFKRISEYIIVLIFLISAVFMIRARKKYSPKLFGTMIIVLELFIIAELMFTLYNDVYGFLNFMGHYIRLVAFFLIYKSIVVEGIQKPYNSIFAELHDLSAKDGLTQLFNHRILISGLEKNIELSVKNNKCLYLMVFDIDNFKYINDTFGHPIGDQVLIEIAKILKNNIRADDIAARQGGDEFSVVIFDANKELVKNIIKRIKESFAVIEITEEKLSITLSGGVVKHNDGSAQELIKNADRLLYKAKKEGGNKIYFEFD